MNFLKKFIYKQVLIKIRQRHYLKNMNCPDLHPPSTVRGMTVLDRDAFRKTIKVPKLIIPEENVNKVLPIVKKLLLKMERLKPIQKTSRNGGDNDDHHDNKRSDKEILLHPLAIQSWENLPKEIEKFGINENNFCYDTIQLTYDNWKADEILKFVLPSDMESLTSFSIIGHIVHINLRDHLLAYKSLIGEVLKDKTVGCRTVVNKAQNIDNTYRNFNIELICGDPDYKVEVKEHGCVFEFDFSKVYWNPRLSTEHERIVNLLETGDILYDVFAGVGPFSIPAARKQKCEVLANDLNPESFKWLNVNVKRNKCSDLVQTFNKDGRHFILEDLRTDLLKRWKSSNPKNYNIHITMNLPAMAVEFLDAFNNLFTEKEIEDEIGSKTLPLLLPVVHVYTFSKDDNAKESIREIIETKLGYKLNDNSLKGIHFVRNVAPNKDMYRVTFQLTEEILFTSSSLSSKKRSVDDENCAVNLKRKC